MNFRSFILSQLSLLEKEQRLEETETKELLVSMSRGQLQRVGLVLLGLYPADYQTFVGGRICVSFSPKSTAVLPKTQIRVGDVVLVENAGQSGGKSDTQMQGTVHKVTKDSISVVFDENDPVFSSPVRLVKSTNSVAFSRMREALNALDPEQVLVKMAFAEEDTAVINSGMTELTICPASVSLNGHGQNLNEQQNEAVRAALSAPHLCLIHGPPGTGKTQCISHILRELSGKSDINKILLCAASNLAVDNVIERCSELNIVRIGHPVRLSVAVLEKSLDYALYSADSAHVIVDIKRDIEKQLARLSSKTDKRQVYRELKTLRNELKSREKRRMEEIMDRARIIACTLHGAGSTKITKFGPFDVVVVDEASQALEAETWVAARQTNKLILVGDHQQLPPTVHCQQLQVTLFERLMKTHRSVMLTVQYRMHRDIMGWSNRRFYHSKLIAHSSVADRQIDKQIPAVQFIDTGGLGMWEKTDVGGSHWNENEAELVVRHYELLEPFARSIAIISPYSAQVDFINNLLEKENVPVGTVDGFQGREADAVIVSLVRSNPEKKVGFLGDARRLNVALTRAQRHLCVIGDSETLRNAYGDLIEYLYNVAQISFPEDNDRVPGP